MQKILTLLIGLILFGLGGAGFYLTQVPNVVQFDLFQSLMYIVAGGIGLKLGTENRRVRYKSYLTAIGVGSLMLLALGLTLPNLGDIIHLEVIENIFHAALAVCALVATEPYLRTKPKTA